MDPAVRSAIEDFRSTALPRLARRELPLGRPLAPAVGNLAKAVVGMRRSGGRSTSARGGRGGGRRVLPRAVVLAAGGPAHARARGDGAARGHGAHGRSRGHRRDRARGARAGGARRARARGAGLEMAARTGVGASSANRGTEPSISASPHSKPPLAARTAGALTAAVQEPSRSRNWEGAVTADALAPHSCKVARAATRQRLRAFLTCNRHSLTCNRQ